MTGVFTEGENLDIEADTNIGKGCEDTGEDGRLHNKERTGAGPSLLALRRNQFDYGLCESKPSQLIMDFGPPEL